MEWKLISGQGYFLKRNELKRSVKKSALVIMAIVTLISVLGFIGWIFDIDILKRPARHLVAINPVTSFALSLCAISFALILFKKNESKRNRMIGLFSVLIALTISLLRVLELAILKCL